MALRRALARLEVRPGYVLTDGFPVDGLGVPGLAVWKGDQVAGSIAAASVIAKVTRDRLMVQLHDRYPAYDFATHKGYVTDLHDARLREHGPCAEHRLSFINVRAACWRWRAEPMSSEDLERYESDMELALYREYRDVVGIFKYVVETDRRFYLCNAVDVKVRSETGDAYFEVTLTDAWVWDIYRPARFAKNVKVLTFKDVNVEELQDSDVKLPSAP